MYNNQISDDDFIPPVKRIKNDEMASGSSLLPWVHYLIGFFENFFCCSHNRNKLIRFEDDMGDTRSSFSRNSSNESMNACNKTINDTPIKGKFASLRNLGSSGLFTDASISVLLSSRLKFWKQNFFLASNRQYLLYELYYTSDQIFTGIFPIDTTSRPSNRLSQVLGKCGHKLCLNLVNSI